MARQQRIKPLHELAKHNLRPMRIPNLRLHYGDGMLGLYSDLKTAYARNAVFGLNRSTLGAVRRLREGGTTGNYLWAPGIATGAPNTILGASYAEMADMPNIAANAFPVVFADWKKLYVIVDRVGMSIRVIPDMLNGATPSFPTGQSGVFAYWRNTARVLNADGGRQGAVQ